MAIAQSNINHIQLVTWNDYGEGTNIEPTVEFGYGFLTTLQQRLGVTDLTQPELEMVAKLYKLRIDNVNDAEVQKKLDQVQREDQHRLDLYFLDVRHRMRNIRETQSEQCPKNGKDNHNLPFARDSFHNIRFGLREQVI
jgi:hypothetical protein